MKRNRISGIKASAVGLALGALVVLAGGTATAQFYSLATPYQSTTFQVFQPSGTEEDHSAEHNASMAWLADMTSVVPAPAWNGWVYGDWVWTPGTGWVHAGEIAELAHTPGAVTYDPSTTRFHGPKGTWVPTPASGKRPSLNDDLGKDPQGNPLPKCLDVCTPSADCATPCWYELDTSELDQVAAQQEADLIAQGQTPPPRSGKTRVQTSCGGYNVCKMTAPPAVIGTGAGGQECIAGTPESKWQFKFGKDDHTGDDFLGAGYSLAASLMAKTSAENGNQGDRQDAHAHAMAYVDVFGGRTELARAQGDAYAVYAKKAGASILFEVLGYTIYSKSWETNLAYTKVLPVPFFKASTTFTIVFIPVTVGVSVDGEIGIYMEAGPLPDGLKGVAKPWIRAYGTAWGGIGVPGLFLGVHCMLTFLEVQAPITGMISIASNCLRWTFDVTLVLKTLGGKLSLNVQFLWINELVELFEWDGLKWNIPLLHQTGVVFFG